MADPRHEAATRLADHRRRHLGDEHARLWQIGEKPFKQRTRPEGAYLDDTAMTQIMVDVDRLGDPIPEGGFGDEQAMQLPMLLALLGRDARLSGGARCRCGPGEGSGDAC
jgi:hypothetical protein